MTARLSRLWTRPARRALDTAGQRVAAAVRDTQRSGARLVAAGALGGLLVGIVAVGLGFYLARRAAPALVPPLVT